MSRAARNRLFDAKLLQAGELISANRISDAISLADALAKSYPDRHETHNLLGVVAIASKRPVAAMKHFELAVAQCPGNPIYWQHLGKAYLDLELFEKSLPAFGRALKIDPNQFEALRNAGELFRKIGRAETGLKYLDAALRLNPKHEEALYSKGASLAALGRAEEADAHYRQMLELGIDTTNVYLELARARRNTKDDLLPAEIARELGRADLNDEQRFALHTALGKFHEDVGNYDDAFENYALGHKYQDRSFDIAAYRDKVDALIATFTPEFFAARAAVGKTDERPVFIVGMPRSGTTLTEQISAGHPQAHGAGELARMNRIAGLLGFHGGNGEQYFKNVVSAIPSDFAQLAAGYQGMMDFLSPTARRIIDKMPHNFQHVGLIAILFPKAHIVHCTRNPIDNCVSIFMISLSERHSYGNNLTTLGLYYREYRRLMKHWKKVLPLPIFEMNYEETTRDLEGQARKLIEFIGLPWDSACLKFNENKSTVQTLSNWQVRQPIYTTSVERWRRYERHLGPLIEALGDLADVTPARA